jgi:hypothetical protein
MSHIDDLNQQVAFLKEIIKNLRNVNMKLIKENNTFKKRQRDDGWGNNLQWGDNIQNGWNWEAGPSRDNWNQLNNSNDDGENSNDVTHSNQKN